MLPNKCSKFVASFGLRWTHTRNGLQQHGGTAVLLLHDGQPRTGVYAAEFLENLFYNKHRVPRSLSRSVIPVLFKERISRCLRTSQEFPYLGDTLKIFARDVERSLSELLPECAPVTCLYSAGGDPLPIAASLRSVMKEESAVDRLIIASLHPFKGTSSTRPLVDEALAELAAHSFGEVSSAGDRWHDFVAKNQKCISFSYLILDEIGAKEAFLKCWAQELVRLTTPDVDGIIFALPSSLRWTKASREDLWHACQRIVRDVHESSSTIVTRMRLAYHPSWSELVALPCRNVKQQLADLRRAGHSGTILVVPLANLFDDFDTQTILPALLQDLDGVKLVKAKEVRDSMLNTFVELIKTRIVKLLSEK